MARALLVKNYQIKSLKKLVWFFSFVYFLYNNVMIIITFLFRHLVIIHFPFNLRRTKTVENITVWKRTEAGAGAGAIKKESFGPGATLMKTKSSGAGAWDIFMKRTAPELCHFCDGSTALLKSLSMACCQHQQGKTGRPYFVNVKFWGYHLCSFHFPAFLGCADFTKLGFTSKPSGI